MVECLMIKVLIIIPKGKIFSHMMDGIVILVKGDCGYRDNPTTMSKCIVLAKSINHI